jgi:predicted nucleotidyltransferase
MSVALQNSYLSTLKHFKQKYGAEYGITQIGFFGSVARGDQTEESDVDILVEASKLGLGIVAMQLKLEEMFNKPVDLVRKTKYMRENFRKRIEQEAIYV